LPSYSSSLRTLLRVTFRYALPLAACWSAAGALGDLGQLRGDLVVQRAVIVIEPAAEFLARMLGFATLDRLLKRLHANKAELLMVLEHPEIPLYNRPVY
jgi:hypothetical protein